MWQEQSFWNPLSKAGSCVSAVSEIENFASSKELKSLVSSITGLSKLDDKLTRIWINRYMPGDYVPAHRDGAGDTQLLICLQELLEPQLGGELFVSGKRIPLKTGDAVLFTANRLTHRVARIESPAAKGSGYGRVTLVTRFYKDYSDFQTSEKV